MHGPQRPQADPVEGQNPLHVARIVERTARRTHAPVPCQTRARRPEDRLATAASSRTKRLPSGQTEGMSASLPGLPPQAKGDVPFLLGHQLRLSELQDLPSRAVARPDGRDIGPVQHGLRLRRRQQARGDPHPNGAPRSHRPDRRGGSGVSSVPATRHARPDRFSTNPSGPGRLVDRHLAGPWRRGHRHMGRVGLFLPGQKRAGP
jgi:hypothetical protein